MKPAPAVPPEALKESVAIVGRTGSGKTYAAKALLEPLLEDHARVCVLDPTGVWWGLRLAGNGESPRFPIPVFGGDHGDVDLEFELAKPLAEYVGEGASGIFDLSEMAFTERIRFATEFLERLYQSNRGPLTLVVDEADLFAPQRVQPAEGKLLNRMETICRRGRVRGFRPWLITQRPAALNKNVLSQANTLIAMQVTAPQDRNAIGDWIEGQADRDVGKRILGELPRLPKGTGYAWSPSHDFLEKVTFPRITTFDSSATPDECSAPPPKQLGEIELRGLADMVERLREQHEQNDPDFLRARIAELEQESERPTEAMKRARQEGYEQARQELTQAYAVSLGRVAGRQRDALAANQEALRALEQELELVRGDAVVLKTPKEGTAEHAAVVAAFSEPARAGAIKRIATRSDAQTLTNGALSKAERSVLTALAQYPHGRAKNQVAVLTGYAVNGGGFNNAISSLRTKGYLEGDAGRLVITPAGKAALGTFTPLPRGRALLDHWLRQLSKAERKTLEELASVYPRTLSKAQLATRSGYEANGGGFNNALSRLRTLELISGRAELKASEDLFS